MARQMGGSATIFIAANAHPVSDSNDNTLLDSALFAIHQRLKNRLDPQGILGNHPFLSY
jgi:FAD/FMN-containing dehydrogenase